MAREEEINNMKKTIFILLLFLILLNFVNATLNEEQLNEAALKIQEKCPEYQLDLIKRNILERDCPPNEISTGMDWIISCKNGNHTYGCSQGIHYLDGQVISILSSKTDIKPSNSRKL